MAPSVSAPPGVPPRWVDLAGTVNFRDLGGYRTADGRQVTWRRLYRADGLSRLTDPDLAALRERGLATVIDLRSSSEQQLGGFPVDRLTVQLHHLPLLDGLPDPRRFALAPGMLAAQYVDIVRDAGPQIGQALTILAGSGTLPAVVHCAAGKDRTGILSAMVLALLGVPDEAIVADYALSGQVMDALRARLIARYPEGREIIAGADELFSAAPENITSLLAAIRERHGSVTAYAASVGAGPAVVDGLRQALLAP